MQMTSANCVLVKCINRFIAWDYRIPDQNYPYENNILRLIA